MDIKKLQALVIDALEDVKAQDIKVFDTVHLTSLFDRIAVASGTSNRQTKASGSFGATTRSRPRRNIVSIEGEDTGEWVLVDLGDMIVHIMQPAIRAYYRLEEIWGEKEVKLGAAKRTASSTAAKQAEADAPAPKRSRHLTVNASQAVDDDEPKKAVRKPRAKPATPAAPPASKKKPTASKIISDKATAAPAAKKKAPPQKGCRQDCQSGRHQDRYRIEEGRSSQTRTTRQDRLTR